MYNYQWINRKQHYCHTMIHNNNNNKTNTNNSHVHKKVRQISLLKVVGSVQFFLLLLLFTLDVNERTTRKSSSSSSGGFGGCYAFSSLKVYPPSSSSTSSSSSSSSKISATTTGGSGGRASSQPNTISRIDENWVALPCESQSIARCIIIQITDVYSLDHFASLKTLVHDTRTRLGTTANVFVVLTGDFLAPYLLSSLDRGYGMMKALNAVPIDYVTWGNHEADINHQTVCKHVQEFTGTWLNSNMLDHEAMAYQKEYDIIPVVSPDGTNHRKIGLCAVLSNNPGLYSQFKKPGAFGGATISDPWIALQKYKTLLEKEHKCDLVIPFQHLYVPDDHITCEKFDFPVVLSGHDHHIVDEIVNGTRLLKPGMDAIYATVLDIQWDHTDDDKKDLKPTITSRFVRCQNWAPDPILAEQNAQAYHVLEPLRNTELARVPPSFEPLSSKGSRERVCTMGQYICSLIKSSLNVARRQRQLNVDVVLLMGGNIRGSKEYPPNSFFSLEALESEIKSDEVIAVLPLPGSIIADGIQVTHAGEPYPGWLQYDIGVQEDTTVQPPVVTHLNHDPIDRNKMYRVATKISDFTSKQCPIFYQYAISNPNVLPPKGAYVNIRAELFSYFARNLWRKIWDSVSNEVTDLRNNNTDNKEKDSNTERSTSTSTTPDSALLEEAAQRLAILNQYSEDQILSVNDIHRALRDRLGYSVDDRDLTLATFVHSYADTNGSGSVTIQDFIAYAQEISTLYANDAWRLAYPKQQHATTTTTTSTAKTTETVTTTNR